MKFNRIAVISVPVKDQKIAKDFYTGKLGFQVIAEQPMGPDQTWLQLGLPGAETSITLVTWFDTMAPGGLDGTVLNTDNIQEVYDELTAKGVQVTPIDRQPWGAFASFKDPDGNGWVIQQN